MPSDTIGDPGDFRPHPGLNPGAAIPPQATPGLSPRIFGSAADPQGRPGAYQRRRGDFSSMPAHPAAHPDHMPHAQILKPEGITGRQTSVHVRYMFLSARTFARQERPALSRTSTREDEPASAQAGNDRATQLYLKKVHIRGTLMLCYFHGTKASGRKTGRFGKSIFWKPP